jgi:hypothetical protein
MLQPGGYVHSGGPELLERELVVHQGSLYVDGDTLYGVYHLLEALEVDCSVVVDGYAQVLADGSLGEGGAASLPFLLAGLVGRVYAVLSMPGYLHPQIAGERH